MGKIRPTRKIAVNILKFEQCFYRTLMGQKDAEGRTDGPRHAKTCLMPYANNKGADQPAHLRSLISTFVVGCLDSIMPLVYISEISRL